MKRFSGLLLTLALIAPAALAQLGISGGGADATPKASIEGSVSKRTGVLVEGVVTVKVLDGWHINSAHPLDDFAIPTTLALDPATAELVSATYPPHELKAFAFSGGRKIAVYEGSVQIPFTAKLKPGGQSITATLRYQACSNNICMAPTTASAEIGATPGMGAAPSAAVPSAAPAAAAPEPAPAAPAPDRLASTFAASGLPLTLLILFIGGLALNLTPCVLPVIPITLGFFAMQSDGRRGRRFALSATYVLGLVVMYSALGVLAALGGKMFGAWLQLPAVLIGFALLMLVLASSMFGAFEIQPPRWIANRSQGRAGLAGALIMGLLIGIVAAPCVGPVVISLLSLVASIGKPVIGGAMFAALAFGLGFPYLALLNVLPRPGVWMLQVKKAMGFVLIAMAFYFLRPLTGDEVFRWGAAASLLIGAAFLFLSSGVAGRAMRLAMAVLLLAGGIAFAWPSSGVHVQWQNYDAAALISAKTSKQPVVLDFTADWCIPCKELESRTFSNPDVAKELKNFSLVRADVTKASDTTTRLLTQYGVAGPPTVIFLDASGQERKDLRLIGFESADKFLARLRAAR